MRFDRESYRKLYVRESAEDRMKPLFQRGLRDYLLRQAKDDGTLLERTDDPAGDLAKALVAHPSERKLLRTFVEDLIGSGYLTHEDRRLWITRFEEAQSARSKGAIRQANYRANRNAKASHDNVTDDVTGDAGEPSPVTLPLADETRNNRRDPVDETPKPPQSDAKIACPKNLWDLMTEDEKQTLETVMIPKWAQEQICRVFAQKQQRSPGNPRPLSAWVSTVIRVIQADWGDPNKRPRRAKPEPDDPALAEPRVKTFREVEGL